ncbi:MAG: NRDE family protein [Halobacteriales archaeon]
MCTLVVAWQVLEETPIAVAANRDEALDRPAKPPTLIEQDPGIVAPLDVEAGGTWLGYNEHGLLVGLSNRWSEIDREGTRSRGRLVRDLLGSDSAAAAGHHLGEAVRSETYEPFNLLVADPDEALVFEWDDGLRPAELEPGVHAILNAGWDDRFVEVPGRQELSAEQLANAGQLRTELAVGPGETAEDWLDRAAAVLADHKYGVCIHRDGFGTRSCSLIALRPEGALYRYADGPPCETAVAQVEAQV